MEVWFWVALIIALSIWEAATVGLVSIWFIISAIVSLVLSILKVKFIICFAVFVVLGLLLMILTRKYLIKILKVDKKERTNIDRIIGKKGVVTEEINKNNIGEVKVDGKKWSAYSDESLEKGDSVKILKIDSVKLKVEKWEE